MKTVLKTIRRVCLIILVLSFVISVPFSFTYWGKQFEIHSTNISIGEFGLSENPFDTLPPNTPQDVIDRLVELTGDNSPEVIASLISSIRDIVNSPEFTGNIHAAADMDGFFDEGQRPINGGDILIYTTTDEHGNTENTIIYVNSSSNFAINSTEDLINALSYTWTGVNRISSAWISGNTYSPQNAPVYYNGRYFLMYFSGPSGTPPSEDRNAWFEVMPNYEYSTANRYYTGQIVSRFNQYYIANQYATWAAPSLNPQSWEPWTIIPQFSSGTTYNIGQSVYIMGQDGEATFWRALRGTSVPPSEQSATAGEWRQFNSGWLGTNDGETSNIIKSYYYAHNTYSAGDTVIFGVSPKLWYRYYRAKADVPAFEPPVVVGEDGIARINEEYWQMVYYNP